MNKIPGKKKIFTFFLIILMIINIIAAIFIFADIQIIKSPKTDVEIKVVDISADELVLEIIMKMRNPNSFELSVEDFKITSKTNKGDKIADINIKGGKIPSDKTKTFTVTDKISFKENSDFKVLNNKITGKIGIKILGFIKKTIPIELNVKTSVEEIIDEIEIPDIDLKFGFEELSEDGLKFSSGINIYNPNDIGITINKLLLNALNDNGENVGSFVITGGEIKPKDHSFFNSSGVLLYKFVDTTELTLSLSGNASLLVAGMNKSITLSTDLSVILPDIQEFIFQNENIMFYIPVQFKLTLRGIQSTVGFKYYNPSNVTLIAKNLHCIIFREDNGNLTQLGKEDMESCIIDPKKEVCVKTEILIPYIKFLKAGDWKILPDWIVLTIEGDFAIAGTRQAVPLSLNAYVNPNIFQDQIFTK